MKIKLTFWGVAQRLAGMNECSLELATGATVQHAVDALDASEAFQQELKRCAFSVGTEIVTRSRVLQDGDDLAVLPPVNGG